MDWQEIIEARKKEFLLASVLVIVLIFACIVRSCTGAGTKQLDKENTLPDGAYLAKVTYVINLQGADEEPITILQQVASNGKAVEISEVQDTEDTVWSGWLTEDGNLFDFDTVLYTDTTLYCYFYDDQNHNNIADGTLADPITVYEFQSMNGTVMYTHTVFGLDTEFDYSAEEYAFPQSENDGYIFLGWTESGTDDNGSGVITVVLMPELASDRNNNDLVDGSEDDPYVYHVFLDQDGDVLEEIRWLDGEEPVKPENVACPTTTKQKLTGWNREESLSENGEVVYTYTPKIINY